MGDWKRWVGLGTVIGLSAALLPLFQAEELGFDLQKPLSKIEELKSPVQLKPDLDGLDLLDLHIKPRWVETTLRDGRRAVLTLDPDLQRSITSVITRYQIPEAGVILTDIKSGKILAYVSHVENGVPFDVNVRARAPAASVFKMVTGAALAEHAALTAQTEQCYHGGHSRIDAAELQDDPIKDKWCATLTQAMARSLNVVFARLAQKHLTAEQLTKTAGALGFGNPVSFAALNEASVVDLPVDSVEFARSAAGFWHSTLSPLQGAVMAQTIANHGVALSPQIIDHIRTDKDEILWELDQSQIESRAALRPEVADEVAKMMSETVSNGSGYKAFHDRRNTAYLGEIPVSGKTGTLSDHQANRHYTWFVGFAPSDNPEIAVSALVVNTPEWTVKGPDLARDALRAYFAKQAAPKVSYP